MLISVKKMKRSRHTVIRFTFYKEMTRSPPSHTLCSMQSVHSADLCCLSASACPTRPSRTQQRMRLIVPGRQTLDTTFEPFEQPTLLIGRCCT